MKSLLFKYILQSVLLYLMIISASNAWAQKNNKRKFAVIDVIIEDTTMLHNLSLKFNMSNMDVNTYYSGYADTRSGILRKKRTRIKIPLSSSLEYGRIVLGYDQNPTEMPLNNSNNVFLFEGGDTIVMHLMNKKNGAWFTGNKAEKYNCMYKISNHTEITSFAQSNYYFQLKNYTAALTSKQLQFDSTYQVQLGVLKTYAGKFGGQIYNLIQLDCLGAHNQRIVELFLNDAFMMKQQNLYQPAKELFLDSYQKLRDNKIKNASLIIKSFEYCDFLMVLERAYAVISKSTAKDNYYSQLKFMDVNQAIDSHFKKGIIKDKIKLLAFMNINRRRQSDFTNYINEAVDEAGPNQFKAALIRFRNANLAGAIAFPFQFPDLAGKIYKLTDFTGKLVIVDFWYTGCFACTQMARALKPIVASYKNNPNVIFITVSIDGLNHRNWWVKSLGEEIYCTGEEVNLLAVDGKESAIVKHYNIDSYPALIAISKDGKIISTAPPDPRVNRNSFIDFISRNL